MTRPERLVLVTGSSTGVGKTWLTAQLLQELLRHGVSAAARKPVQSFASEEGPTDAELLARAADVDPYTICPAHRWYGLPLAPPIAADLLGRSTFNVHDLIAELVWDNIQVGIVEGSGGPRSPLASDGDTVSLAERIKPDQVILVVDAGLGAINATRLCMESLIGFPVVVYLNRFDPSNPCHAGNLEWLCARSGLEVVVNLQALVERFL